MRKRGWAIAGSAVGAAGLVAMASGGGVACTTHQCDGSFLDYFGGDMVDEDTYETNAFDQQWLDFPGMRSYLIHFPRDLGRAPDWAKAYVGTDPNANAPGNLWSEASGNLAEMGVASSTGIFVYNDTCADYTLRVVVHFPSLDAGPDASTDGGTD